MAFDSNADVSQLVKNAYEGDEAANTLLLEVAAYCVKREISLEVYGPLQDFVIEFLRNPQAKRKRGRKHSAVAQRDSLISYVVWRINHRWKFDPTRNEATKSASAISITKQALKRVGIHLTEAAITKIWTRDQREMADWKKSRGIK